MVGGGGHVAFGVPDFHRALSSLVCTMSAQVFDLWCLSLRSSCSPGVCPLKQPEEEGGLVLPGRHPLGFACTGCEKGLQDPRLARLSLGVGHRQVLCPAFLSLLSLHPPLPLSLSERKGDSESPPERFVGQWCREEPCLEVSQA